MLDDIGIDIQGLKAMETALMDIAKEIGSGKTAGMMTSSLRDGAQEFKEEIIATAPVSNKQRSKIHQLKPYHRSGFYKSKIKVWGSTNRRAIEGRNFDKNVISLVRVGVFKVFYAHWLEFGNSQQPANPIIRKAFIRKAKDATLMVNLRLARRIELAQRRIARKHKQKGKR